MALYVVATPIGNLGEMSPRAVDTLKNVSLIAAEDTRVTMKLLNHFGIRTPLVSCHQHNEEKAGPQIAERMQAENLDAALVTDAGTPGISDPGGELVKACVERGIEVFAVAGPSALAAAISVSGLDMREFTFYGFLPREKKSLREKLQAMRRGCSGAVVHESPYRITELAECIAETLPEARLSVSCDLTKLHEKTLRGSPEEVLAMLKENEKTEKGEYCIVMDLRACIDPPTGETTVSPEGRIAEMMMAGLDLRGARDALAAEGIAKNTAYAAALKVKKWLDGAD